MKDKSITRAPYELASPQKPLLRDYKILYHGFINLYSYPKKVSDTKMDSIIFHMCISALSSNNIEAKDQTNVMYLKQRTVVLKYSYPKKVSDILKWTVACLTRVCTHCHLITSKVRIRPMYNVMCLKQKTVVLKYSMYVIFKQLQLLPSSL